MAIPAALAAILLLLQAPAPGQAQSCLEFHSNQICNQTAGNLVGEIPDVEDPLQCQALCLASEECTHFSWMRYKGSTNYPPDCLLFRSCSSRESCSDPCEYSLSGPEKPVYNPECCEQFLPGESCSGNQLSSESNFLLGESYCQQLCQETADCHFYTHGFIFLILLLEYCNLYSTCDSTTSCLLCSSGPKYPDIDTCEGPSAQAAAALLLGGHPDILKVESWPCGLAIPNVPRIANDWPGAAVLGGKVYFCGGRDQSDNIVADCSVLENNAWRAGPDMLNPRRFFPLISIGNMLVAPGGSGKSSYYSSVEILRSGGTSWELASWSLSSARNGHCAVVLSDTEIILAGGKNPSTFLNIVEKYNVVSGKAIVLPSMSHAASGPGCALWQGNLVVSGGFVNPSSGVYSPYNNVEMLDLSSKTWSKLPSLTQARYFHTMGVVNGALAVFGSSGADSAASSVEVLTGNTWKTEQLDSPRGRHAMVQLPCH